MEGDNPLPENDLRCKRTDGRDWRCKRAVVTGKSFCETHLYRSKKQSSASSPNPNLRVKFRVRVKPQPAPLPDPDLKGQMVVGLESEQLKVKGKTPKKMKKDNGCGSASVVPENLRCRKTNGKDWRCKRQAIEGLTLCEKHKSKVQSKEKLGIPSPENKNEQGIPLSENGEKEGIPLPGYGEKEGIPLPENGAKEGIPLTENGEKEALPLPENGEKEAIPSPVNKVETLPVPEGLRCSRNDGREWRCKRQVMEGKTLCEAHYKKLKIKAVRKNVEEDIGKILPRKKRRESTPVPENLRCSRTDEGEWRCKRRVIDGEILCGFHLKELKKAKSGSSSRPKLGIKVENRSKKSREKGCSKPDLEVEGVEFRCKRTDGRGWRCKKKALEGKTLCEIHHEQGRLRQMKVVVPESLKIQRGSDGDKIEKGLKRKRALEDLENNSDKGMKRMKAELIRVFLRREIIESSKKSEKDSENAPGEVTRDLPYGLMAIPPAPTTQFLDNAGSLGIKVGANGLNSTVKRRFRSKNIEPPPISTLKVVPYVGNSSKMKNKGRRSCHWCQHSENRTLTKCLSCKKQFFCHDCIKERDTDPEKVKQRCPVCCGSCGCKNCYTTLSNDDIVKEHCNGSNFQYLQYLISYLLPVLVQINQEQTVEVETEAKLKGQNLCEVDVQQANVGFRDRCCCNNCKNPILDLHRSCPNCSYNLCLHCCRKYTQYGSLRGVKSSTFQWNNQIMTHCHSKSSENMQKSNYDQSMDNCDIASSDSMLNSSACLLLSCPPMELGGCDNSLLELKCIFPLNWTRELEICAQEMVPDGDFLQTTNDSAHCIFCGNIPQDGDNNKELQEVSKRKGSNDNFLYCPSTSDNQDRVLTHFQKHWQNGQPVKVRNVIHSVSNLSWDPLAMFCDYLENSCSTSGNVRDESANYSDWYDVEIGTKNSFIGSTWDGYTRMKTETLRIKAKLSSSLSRRLFEGHYSDIINSLPLQEYTNPRSGLLNLTGRLPEDPLDYKLGPHVCISCGSREEIARGELVIRLCYNSHDVVNIMVHAGDTLCSKEHINKVKKLMRQSNLKGKGQCSSRSLENEETRMHSGALEGNSLSQGVGGASNCSTATNGASCVNLKVDGLLAKVHCSDTVSDASIACSEINDSPVKSVDQMSKPAHLYSSDCSKKGHSQEPCCGSRWDVFRREDIPKLLQYIAKHAEELSYGYGLRESVVHPIFDGSFYLDAVHKMRLKEEFNIEPWTFDQCLGEAVFIPAGCPYQIRNFKSCVNITLGFLSPENVSECIKLTDEIRGLPTNHKSRQDKLEVEKMAICSIDEAIKEMYRLKSKDLSQPSIRNI